MRPFKFTDKQLEAQQVVGSSATHILFDGGARSGKTFLHCRNIAYRALKAPGSRHLIARFRFNHCKQSVGLDTFPKMMRLCFPGVPYKIDKSDWYIKLGDNSEIWIGGLDDKERTEKILGFEYATIYLVECSQISWDAVETVKTRLAQNVVQIIERDGQKTETALKLRMFYDCNPPSKAHWTYQQFHLKKQPGSKKELTKPDNYACVLMNPGDNRENLPKAFFDEMEDLSAHKKNRFLYGRYSDATPGQLFDEDTIEKWRNTDGDRIPEFIRIVVGVDPSGADDTDNADNDSIGIVAGALGTDGKAYLLEDNTVKAGPSVWGRVAVDTYDRLGGDKIVGEENFGGAMVKYTIKTHDSQVNYGKVTATRGKTVRAEPFSSLYEQGKVVHVGRFPELEDQMTAFTTRGYLGEDSPNNADAWFWVLAELFPGIVRKAKKKEEKRAQEPRYSDYIPDSQGWMA